MVPCQRVAQSVSLASKNSCDFPPAIHAATACAAHGASDRAGRKRARGDSELCHAPRLVHGARSLFAKTSPFILLSIRIENLFLRTLRSANWWYDGRLNRFDGWRDNIAYCWCADGRQVYGATADRLHFAIDAPAHARSFKRGYMHENDGGG